MKYLRYEDIDKNYEIDWEKGERRFRVPFTGIRVYERGPTEVDIRGVNNPDWRGEARMRCGIDVRLMSELSGFALFDPSTGRKVPKSSVDTKLVCVNKKWGRIYQAGGWNVKMCLVSEHAQPSCSSSLTYYTPDKNREDAVLEVLKPYYDLGCTLNSLEPANAYRSINHHQFPHALNMLVKSNMPMPDITTQEGQEVCRIVHTRYTQLRKRVHDMVRVKNTVEFLTYTRKEG